jgi:hypothetical protein
VENWLVGRHAETYCLPIDGAAGARIREMVSPDSQGRELVPTDVGTRVRVIAGTTRRQFAFRWSAPRSPAGRLLALPVFVVAAILMLLVALLAVLLVVTAAAVAFGLALLARGRQRALTQQQRR